MCDRLHVWSATCVVSYMCDRLHVWSTKINVWSATCAVGYMCGRLHVWLAACVVMISSLQRSPLWEVTLEMRRDGKWNGRIQVQDMNSHPEPTTRH